MDKYPKIRNELIDNFSNTKIVEIDEVTEGQACTCKIGIDQCNIDLDKPILISACDNGVYYDKEKYNKLLEDETIDVIVWSFKHNPTSKNNPDMYAWLDINKEDDIRYVSVKKCIFDNPYEHCAIIGTMFFRKGRYFMEGLKEIYTKNTRTNGEYYVDNVLNELIANGYKVKNFEVEHYICWGTPDDYETYKYWYEYFV